MILIIRFNLFIEIGCESIGTIIVSKNTPSLVFISIVIQELLSSAEEPSVKKQNQQQTTVLLQQRKCSSISIIDLIDCRIL